MKATGSKLLDLDVRDARAEWVALTVALVELGREPGCADEPERWWSKRRDAVAEAVAVCAWCPVQGWCRDYALAAQEPGGVWGGLTHEDRRAIGSGHP